MLIIIKNKLLYLYGSLFFDVDLIVICTNKINRINSYRHDIT